MGLPLIAAHHTIILRLPSGAFKLITVNPKASVCSLGKFGSFNANDLVGHPYGRTYEIQTDKSLKVLATETLKKIEDDELGNNEFIVDDQLSNQSLSHDEIRALRDSGDREALIEKLKQNNKSFELKTEYSKEKYTARKMAKFAPRFTVVPPTIFDVIDYLLDKDCDRILHVNRESMAYMLSAADVRPGCHYLVVDDVSGLLVSAVLERGARLTLIHDTEHPNMDVVKYFPQFNLETLIEDGIVRTITWDRVVDPEESYAEIDGYLEQRSISKLPRDVDRAAKRQQLRQTIVDYHSTSFDGCLVMSKYTPTSIVPAITASIATSRKIAVYSAYREPLLSLRHRNDQEYLAPSIIELRAREYQILQGRTRPVMTKRGEWGYIYHAIKVERQDGITAIGKNQKSREKKNAETKAAKRSEAISSGAVREMVIRTESTEDCDMQDSEQAQDESDFEDRDAKRVKLID